MTKHHFEKWLSGFRKKMTRKQKAKQVIRPLANANLLSAAS